MSPIAVAALRSTGKNVNVLWLRQDNTSAKHRCRVERVVEWSQKAKHGLDVEGVSQSLLRSLAEVGGQVDLCWRSLGR